MHAQGGCNQSGHFLKKAQIAAIGRFRLGMYHPGSFSKLQYVGLGFSLNRNRSLKAVSLLFVQKK
jgi:hypothetical protein